MNDEAREIIARLGLERLPHEGGYFRQTWKTAEGTAIYFLITPREFSALHRLRTPEVWHFYAGDPVEHVQLDPREGLVRVVRLGADVTSKAEMREVPQLVVPGGVWQGARLAPGGRRGWALMGTTMAPPWNEREFELGERAELTAAFPAEAARIRALTRG